MNKKLCSAAVLFALGAACSSGKPTGSVGSAITADQLAAKVAAIGTLDNIRVTALNDLTTLPQRPSAYCPSCMPNADAVGIAPANPADWPQVGPVPGFLITADVEGDPQSHFLMRIPNTWNRKMVVAGTGGVRSEYSNDIIISDYVLNKGYAYVTQNKGFLGQQLVSYDSDGACPLLPVDDVPTRSGHNLFAWFAMLEPSNHIAEWGVRMSQAALTGREILQSAFRSPTRSYAIGASNGGFQVRLALEQDKGHLFDGGVDWEGVFFNTAATNGVGEMATGLRNYPAYRASGFDPNSAAAQAIQAVGYPPDLIENNTSVWTLFRNKYWESTECLYGRKLDADYYSQYLDLTAQEPFSIVETYDYPTRQAIVAQTVSKFEVTGAIPAPLITVHGTLDALIPLKAHSRKYAAAVQSSGHSDIYRLYEIQNGTHIDGFQALIPDLVLMMPHAHHAFDLLVDWVENGHAAPASQCVPKGAQISGSFAETSCSQLKAP
jgi:hypothetical protein